MSKYSEALERILCGEHFINRETLESKHYSIGQQALDITTLEEAIEKAQAFDIVKRHSKISSMYGWKCENTKITVDTNNVIYYLNDKRIDKEEYDILQKAGVEEDE